MAKSKDSKKEVKKKPTKTVKEKKAEKQEKKKAQWQFLCQHYSPTHRHLTSTKPSGPGA